MIRSQAHKQSEHTVFVRAGNAAFRHGELLGDKARNDTPAGTELPFSGDIARRFGYEGAVRDMFRAGYLHGSL